MIRQRRAKNAAIWLMINTLCPSEYTVKWNKIMKYTGYNMDDIMKAMNKLNSVFPHIDLNIFRKQK